MRDKYEVFGYMVAAAILIPLGWWMKDNLQIAEWLRATFS